MNQFGLLCLLIKETDEVGPIFCYSSPPVSQNWRQIIESKTSIFTIFRLTLVTHSITNNIIVTFQLSSDCLGGNGDLQCTSLIFYKCRPFAELKTVIRKANKLSTSTLKNHRGPSFSSLLRQKLACYMVW